MTTTTPAPRDEVRPGVITVFSDIWCSFAHVAMHRLHTTRARLGLEDRVRLNHRAFPLEMFNNGPSPRPGTDSEVGGVAHIEPEAGWQLWRAPDWKFPSTSLPALEAVQLAKEQGLEASERLDLALRRAFWAESRSIGAYAVVLAVAKETEGIDPQPIAEGLAGGRARALIARDFLCAKEHGVICSPHFYLPDGSDHANPGVAARWHGAYGTGFPEVTANDRGVYEAILERAAD
ncbi:DsbA family protein [Streptomyces olivoreticuli]|uniref:DsbA family oxidoreductase n=1 Tax=Streptomyces olivoreticuli TaxID=68246 RepID=UPI000E241F73|nr:DsbA family protein [Streptomyces olivoreticuli]